MANKVTGSTDTSGALSITPSTPKSVMVIGVSTSTEDDKPDANEIHRINSTNDALMLFGKDSPLVDAVKILIKGGVNSINGIIVDTVERGDTTEDQYNKAVDDAYDKALTKSLDDESVKVIVVDDGNKHIPGIKSHLQYAEENDMFRYSVIVPDNDVDSMTELADFAKSVDYSRIFVPGPTMVDGSANKVHPAVASAALGAVIMTETDDPALPLDGVQIKGLGGVSRRVMKEEKDVLGNSGITPLYTSNSLPTIHRLVTSCVSDKVYQEGTVRFVADHVLETVENTLRQNYKRTKNVSRILGDTGIRGTVKTILMTMQDREIIENFDESTLTVIKDPSDMYGALVDYEIDVVTPLYTITITQHLKL